MAGVSCYGVWVLAYYCVAEGTGSDPTDHFLEFVGVDTETVECAGLGKFAVRSV